MTGTRLLYQFFLSYCLSLEAAGPPGKMQVSRPALQQGAGSPGGGLPCCLVTQPPVGRILPRVERTVGD